MTDGRSTLARFLNNITIGDGCWEWGGGTNSGYGRFQVGGRQMYTHRYALSLIGVEVPTGHDADHLCRNKLCVRFDHLEVVDHRANVLRGVGPTSVNSQKTHCPYGHAYDSGWEYRAGRMRRSCRECQRQANRRYRLGKAMVRVGTFTCDECGAGFDNERGVRAHMGRRHRANA
jgi:hypothetical protein